MKHQLNQKRIVSILLAVCMLVSMLSVGMAGALDVSKDPYATVNGGNAYYRYFIPGQYLERWANNSQRYDGQTHSEPERYWTVYENLWNGTAGHSTNKAAALDGISAEGGLTTIYGTDRKTDAFYIHKYDLDGGLIPFQSYYGVFAPSLQMTIRVPSSDTYTLKGNMLCTNGGQANAVAYWIAPVSAEDPMAEEYSVGTMKNIKSNTDVNGFYEVGIVELAAGEYIVTQKVADGETGSIFGGSIELWGTKAPTEVTLTADATALNAAGQLEVRAGSARGASISINAVSSGAALDLINAPTYARVDEYSDAITATYENGMVNVVASATTTELTTSATLYLEVAGAATWVEIPVKVVPGGVSGLNLSHTGATNNIVENIGSYPITLSATVDSVETEIMAEDVINVEIVDSTGAVTDAVTATVDGATVTFIATKDGTYTAKITATIDGVSTTAVYEVPLTVSDFSLYYNFLKIGTTARETGSKDDGGGYWIKEFIDSYSDTWTGAEYDINPAVISDGWKVGAKGAASGEWLWTGSAEAMGAYLVPNGSWNSMDIFVPASGTYEITSSHYLWSTGGDVEYYIAPVGTEDPIQEQYKLNTVSHYGAAQVPATVSLGEATLEAGEYMIVLKSAKALFQQGIKMELTTHTNETKVWLDNVKSVPIAEYADMAKTYWTWTPKVLPTFLAGSVTIKMSSSNEGILKISADGRNVIPVRDGYAELIFTASDGATSRVQAIVGQPDASYDILSGGALATYNSGKTYLDQTAYYGGDWTKAEADGYGAWSVVDGSSYRSPTYPAGFQVTSGIALDKLCGIFTAYGDSPDTNFSRIKINVSEAGKYRIKTYIDQYVHNAPYAIYLAPVDATDAVAAQYKIAEFTATRLGSVNNSVLDGRSQIPVLLDEVNLETAGEYYLTFKKIPSGRGSTVTTSQNNYDYITVGDFKFYKLDKDLPTDVTLDTRDGAEIRTTGKQGLRFTSSIAKTGDFASVVEFGTVLIPTADLTNATDLKIGYSANGNDALKVPAVYYFEDNEDEVIFTAVITDIVVANYKRSISARAYAIVKDVYGNEITIYGDDIISRSVYEVAENGLADPNVKETDKAAFEDIMAAVEAFEQENNA